MPLVERAYKSNIATIKKYGDRYKLTFFKFPLRTSGVEVPTPKYENENVCSFKLDNSISRTRALVYELAACNQWEYFVTLTLDKAKYDRYDLDKFRADLSQWLRNQRRLKSCEMRYLLIPEQHKDGAWHMHGLMLGIPPDALTVNENGYLDYPLYGKKFGYVSLSPVRDLNKVASYITKYISKNLIARKEELNAHLYYASKGLNHAVLMRRGGFHPYDEICPDYENEHVLVKWFDSYGDDIERGFD